mgnify:CR=1 FL=1
MKEKQLDFTNLFQDPKPGITDPPLSAEKAKLTDPVEKTGLWQSFKTLRRLMHPGRTTPKRF